MGVEAQEADAVVRCVKVTSFHYCHPITLEIALKKRNGDIQFPPPMCAEKGDDRLNLTRIICEHITSVARSLDSGRHRAIKETEKKRGSLCKVQKNQRMADSPEPKIYTLRVIEWYPGFNAKSEDQARAA